MPDIVIPGAFVSYGLTFAAGFLSAILVGWVVMRVGKPPPPDITVLREERLDGGGGQ